MMFDPPIAHLGNNNSPYQNHVGANIHSSISNQQLNGISTSSNNYLQNTLRYTPVTTQISSNNSAGNRYISHNDSNMPGLIDVDTAMGSSGSGAQNGGLMISGGLATFAAPMLPIDERLCGFGSVISRATPDVDDKTIHQSLEQYIQGQGIFENDADLFRRIEALTCLEKVCNKWITSVYARLNAYTKQQIEEVNGSLFTFGSYRLGVHFRGGDIDTLLLAPRRVEREQFFTEMPQLLREQPECETVTAVPDAFAPIITMVLGGVEIDLLFCQCRLLDSIPRALNVLQIDVQTFTATLKDLRSLNGCRVNEYILSCVPDQETFRNALRVIKYWAKRRCIYSNILGYLGGVSWALLVAFTCQHYPYANAAMVVKKMFLVFSEWDWPQPVFVRDPRDMDGESSIENNLSGMPVWDARINSSDRAQLMPIITPVFPQQNTTYNVQRSQYVILLSEINRGYSICEKIWKNEVKWDKLFEPLPFFLHRNYVVVIAESDNDELFKSYCGFVESRLRKLVELVASKQDIIRLCRAHPRQFGVANATRPAAMWLFGLDMKKDEAKKEIKLPLNAFADVGQRFINDIMLDTQQRAMWDDNMVRTQVKQASRRELLNLLPEEVINEYSDLRHLADAVKQRAEKVARARASLSTGSAPVGATAVSSPSSTLAASSRLGSTGSLAASAEPPNSVGTPGGLHAVSSSSMLNDSDTSFNTSQIGGDEPLSPLTNLTSVKHSYSSGDVSSSTKKRSLPDEKGEPGKKRLKSSSSTSSLTAAKTHSPSPSSPLAAAGTTARSPATAETDIKIMEKSNIDRRHMADIDVRDLQAKSPATPAKSPNAVGAVTSKKRSLPEAAVDRSDLPATTKRMKSEPVSEDDVVHPSARKPSITDTPNSQLLDSKLPPDFLLKLLPIKPDGVLGERSNSSDAVDFSSATPDLSFAEDENVQYTILNSSSSGDDGSGYDAELLHQQRNVAAFGSAKPIS